MRKFYRNFFIGIIEFRSSWAVCLQRAGRFGLLCPAHQQDQPPQPRQPFPRKPTRRRDAQPNPSQTPTDRPSPTATKTATKTLTAPSRRPPLISPTPTIDFPHVTVKEANAHCRYGPGKAYLHAADLYAGDHGLVWHRNHSGTWIWVRFDKLNYACWVAASVTEIDGDVFSVSAYFPPLPKSTLYGPPQKVIATRNGETVVVIWEEVWMTEDDERGYLIEAKVCQNGYLIDVAVHTEASVVHLYGRKGL